MFCNGNFTPTQNALLIEAGEFNPPRLVKYKIEPHPHPLSLLRLGSVFKPKISINCRLGFVPQPNIFRTPSWVWFRSTQPTP